MTSIEQDGAPADKDVVEDEVEFPTILDGMSKLLGSVARPFQSLLGGFRSEPVIWDESNEYDFTHPCRGTMLIFNNEYFKTHSARPGSTIDAENLSKTFSKLGFDVHSYHNQTRDEMMSVLKKASKENHSNVDCFGCAVLSHGDEVFVVDRRRPGYLEKEDLVYATDQVILTGEITKLFSDCRCPSLKGKPRIFFMQACRGDKLDPGVQVHVAMGEVDEVDATPTPGLGPPPTELVPVPIYKDFLMVYATPPGHYAFRRPDSGSWFVQALCEVFSRPCVPDTSLVRLLSQVVRHVAQVYESQSMNMKIAGKKQTPSFISMLVKDVYFRRKMSPGPQAIDLGLNGVGGSNLSAITAWQQHLAITQHGASHSKTILIK